jgi:hypothetical protein
MPKKQLKIFSGTQADILSHMEYRHGVYYGGYREIIVRGKPNVDKYLLLDGV